MPHITIDGKTLEVEAGKTVIEAASEHGIDIPHFCWHPGLSVAGNCRMCLCEVGSPKRTREGALETDENGNPVIGYIPKLQIACATPITDGMHVRLETPKVKQAQEAVMEFLLINHPLDCPICDEAGQCKLQEYGFRHSKGESRFDELKNAKDKRRPLGPNVLFDAERCISCSRCIRYAEEVAEQPALTFVQRGDHVTIETFPDTTFDSPYSMNVIEICPVGALTSPDFRFRARVWDMSFNESVCPGCSRGCNMQVGVRNNEALRLEPKVNMDVNEYWMCDSGRLSQYKLINENRVVEPLVKKNGSFAEVAWPEAVAAAAALLKNVKPESVMAVASAQCSNEDNFAFARFAKDVLKTKNLDFFRADDPAFGDEKLRKADRTPNATGARAVGVQPGQGGLSADALAQAISKGTIKALVVMYDDIASVSTELQAALAKLDVLIVLAAHHHATAKAAHVIMPAPTYAEWEGTFTNFQQRVQYLAPAIVTAENERFMGMKMSRLDKFGAFNDRWTHGERRNCRQPWKVFQMLAKELGNTSWNYKKSADVFADITSSVASFKGMDYTMLKERRGVIFGEADKPFTPVFEYESHVLKPQ